MALPEEDGYRLWLRHARLDADALAALDDRFHDVAVAAPGLELAQAELVSGTLGTARATGERARPGAPGRTGVSLSTLAHAQVIAPFVRRAEPDALGDEGFLLRRVTREGRRVTLIVAAREIGVSTAFSSFSGG